MKFFSKREKTLDGSFFQQCTSYFSSDNTYYSHKEHRTSRSLSVACFRPFPTWLLQSFSGSPVLLNSSDLVTDSLKKTGTTVGIGLFPHLYLPVPTHSDAYPQPLLSILASHKPFLPILFPILATDALTSSKPSSSRGYLYSSFNQRLEIQAPPSQA